MNICTYNIIHITPHIHIYMRVRCVCVCITLGCRRSQIGAYHAVRQRLDISHHLLIDGPPNKLAVTVGDACVQELQQIPILVSDQHSSALCVRKKKHTPRVSTTTRGMSLVSRSLMARTTWSVLWECGRHGYRRSYVLHNTLHTLWHLC